MSKYNIYDKPVLFGSNVCVFCSKPKEDIKRLGCKSCNERMINDRYKIINESNKSLWKVTEHHRNSIPFIKNDDTVIDIGYSTGIGMAYVKYYLKKNGIEFTLIGIDKLVIETTEHTKQFDQLIHSRVQDLTLKNIADVIVFNATIVFECNDSEVKQLLEKIADMLKPDGIILIDVEIKGKLSLGTKEDFEQASRNNMEGKCLVFTKYGVTNIRKMTKQDLLEHSKHDFYQFMVDSCDHGELLSSTPRNWRL